MVLASPSFRTLCNTERLRQQIVTAVTINQLLAQGLDILTPAPLVELLIRPDSAELDLRSALSSLYSQIKTKKRLLQLDEQECRALRDIEDIVLWVIDGFVHADTPNIGSNPYNAPVRFLTIPPDESEYWMHVGWDSRHYRITFDNQGYAPLRVEMGYRDTWFQAYCNRQSRLGLPIL